MADLTDKDTEHSTIVDQGGALLQQAFGAVYDSVPGTKGYAKDELAAYAAQLAKSADEAGRPAKIGFNLDGTILFDLSEEGKPKAWIIDKKEGDKPSNVITRIIGWGKDGFQNLTGTNYVLSRVQDIDENITEPGRSGFLWLDSEANNPVSVIKGGKVTDSETQRSVFYDGYLEAIDDANDTAQRFKDKKQAEQDAKDEEASRIQDQKDARKLLANGAFNDFVDDYNKLDDSTKKINSDLYQQARLAKDYDNVIAAFEEVTGISTTVAVDDNEKFYAFTKYIERNLLTPEEIQLIKDKAPAFAEFLPKTSAAALSAADQLAAQNNGQATEPAAGSPAAAPEAGAEQNASLDLQKTLDSMTPLAKMAVGLAIMVGPGLVFGIGKTIAGFISKDLKTAIETVESTFITSGIGKGALKVSGLTVMADGVAQGFNNWRQDQPINSPGSSPVIDTALSAAEYVKDVATGEKELPGAVKAVGEGVKATAIWGKEALQNNGILGKP